ncbi:MAG: hypothetical protein LJE68_16590 [Rhodobacter sp.]|nr:hypothetical protein [Rhodobacter sp.]
MISDPTQTERRCLAGAWLAVALPALLGLGVAPADAKPPKPGEDGQYFCITEDMGDDDDDVVVGPNKCCYEERVNDGDLLTVCIQCDTDWKNCKEVPEDKPGRPQISLPPAGNGTLNETGPRPRSAPVLKLK